eukprot:CAMPEP_0117532786 /NCGR_PEP_ID=MMETSP0784-20121206/39547_1 /TAXON_ID=39447 /ORGANISM="" /LENGTH=495 /DNA_ID=CAMNT_0005329189 /DNA_START=82 /DNA_END=1569 /DNA_ORIENTATION=+
MRLLVLAPVSWLAAWGKPSISQGVLQAASKVETPQPQQKERRRPPALANISSTLFLRGRHGIQAESKRAQDGYTDAAVDNQKLIALDDTFAGDHQGKTRGPEKRYVSLFGSESRHFSILDAVLGPCGSCSPWNAHCTLGVTVAGLLMAWAFKNLKVMSDVYFVPSTIQLAKRHNLPADVAGATLLAFGSSAPEFCTNVVASFFITNECGVGDIVGSAIHNILLIIGVSGLFAGRLLALWWYPLSRDSVFYIISIWELSMFLRDEHLQIWEASIMVGTYFVYCAWMMWNVPIYKKLTAALKLSDDVPEDGDDDDDEAEGILYYDPCEIMWRNIMPSPNSRCLPCFLMSLTQIAWLSYIMVDSATRFGACVGIAPLGMGLVFLAAGTSIPDAFASMAAARKGEGDMAVSNALGSNIFDILCGLGLPWLISLLMGKPVVFLGVGELLYWVNLLMWTLVAFMGVVVIGGFKLGQRVGATLVIMYACYVIWALLLSANIV